jgi:hypothetical protein
LDVELNDANSKSGVREYVTLNVNESDAASTKNGDTE